MSAAPLFVLLLAAGVAPPADPEVTVAKPLQQTVTVYSICD